MQTALSLAVAEEACEFEHRDLHWGNLLVRRDSNKAALCKLRYTKSSEHASFIEIHTTIQLLLSVVILPCRHLSKHANILQYCEQCPYLHVLTL